MPHIKINYQWIANLYGKKKSGGGGGRKEGKTGGGRRKVTSGNKFKISS